MAAGPEARIFSGEEEMVVSASALAQLVDRLRPLDLPELAGNPLHAESASLYPQPHNPVFDFSLHARSADWIDRLARAGAEARRRDRSAPVIGHTDWSARNLRIDDGRLAAVYDWDSLALVAESTLVGQAAATWRSTGESSDPVAPGAEEVGRYIRAYESSARRRLTQAQTRAALGSALWVLAYSGRCEHALEAVTGRRVERARAQLAQGGWRFLSDQTGV
jgi:hypothetical protein